MLDTRNRLLAALPAEAQALLAPHLERVELEARELVYDFDRPITHVVFPESAVVSIVGVMADGSAVETGTVGREGMAGVPVVLGADRTNAQGARARQSSVTSDAGFVFCQRSSFSRAVRASSASRSGASGTGAVSSTT